MQASFNENSPSKAKREVIRDFENNLKLSEQKNEKDSHDEYHKDINDDGEEFSFPLVNAVNFSTISAEDAFHNGQIKPLLSLSDRALPLLDDEDLESLMWKDRLPKVKKVFIPAEDDDFNVVPEPTGDEDIVGPYCEWSKKVVEAAPVGYKKSNSTGFSKIWRFKEIMHRRSNSDGRDAFDFLNHASPSEASRKVNGSGEAAEKIKVKRVRKNETAQILSAHQAYMRRSYKATGDPRRSDLPYRRELVWLFTN